MELIGHRGCANQYPENTVGALVRSAAVLDTIEIDVRRCASGELVVFHDERVDRLTSDSGRLSEFAWSELQELEILDSGEPITRLSSALAAVPADVRVQIELKEEGLAEDVRDTVVDSDTTVSVSSFRPEALAAINDLDWEVSTGFLFESNPETNLETAVELGCDAVHPHYDLCLETDVVETAHEEGLRVVAWKAVETPSEVAALRDADVDAATADRWDIGDVAPRGTSTETVSTASTEPGPAP